MANELLSMAQEFSGLPMDSLIGGPLNAAANANAAMAVTQTKFLLDTCFAKKTDDKGAESYAPIMIKMSLTRGVITPATYDAASGKETTPTKIDQVNTEFNLPLLTIVALNSLAVDEVDITFEMEVKSSFSQETSEEKVKQVKAEASFEAKIGVGCFSATVRGSASYDQKDTSKQSSHYQKSNSAKYTVHVHAGQLPLPKGVNTILEAFTKSIEPITMPTSTTTSK
jgi:hypothetical protein